MIKAYYLPKDATAVQVLTDTNQILDAFRQKQGLLWIDMESPTPEETDLLAEAFGFHPVAVQTCREVTSQPLVHSYDGYLFMVIHAVLLQSKGVDISTSEVDIFWAKNFVLTYHAMPVRSIQEFWQACSADCRALMAKGADFLMHALVDRIIDNFSPALDQIEVAVEEVELQIFRQPTDRLLMRVLDLKQTVAHLMRIAMSQRDVLQRIIRGEFGPITKQAIAYWHEAYDHLVRLVHVMEALREIINTSRDTYMSVVSNRLNAIMKVLTIIATIFMPLTFIVGVYGMNFRHMPEIDWRWGYLAVWVAIACVAVGMLIFFKRKGWL